MAGGSIAELFDTITIGGGFSGIVQIRMEVSGSFLMSDPLFDSGGGPNMGALLSMNIPGGAASQASVIVKQYNSPFEIYLAGIVFGSNAAGGNSTFSSNANPPGTNGSSFADPADVRLVLTVSIPVTPSNPTFNIYARLGTGAGVNSLSPTNGQVKTSEVDFGNSAHLSLILPAGVPWTSDSGVFLQGVPEPSTGALLAAGVLCLSVVGRLRRAAGRIDARSLDATTGR